MNGMNVGYMREFECSIDTVLAGEEVLQGKYKWDE